MMSSRKRVAMLSLAVAASAFGFGQAAYAQQSTPGTGKANPDAPVGPRTEGGTVPGLGRLVRRRVIADGSAAE